MCRYDNSSKEIRSYQNLHRSKERSRRSASSPSSGSHCKRGGPTRLDDILAKWLGAAFFLKLHVDTITNCGFWHFPTAKKSRPLTTFITPFGRYQFNKIPLEYLALRNSFQSTWARTLIYYQELYTRLMMSWYMVETRSSVTNNSLMSSGELKLLVSLWISRNDSLDSLKSNSWETWWTWKVFFGLRMDNSTHKDAGTQQHHWTTPF